MYLDCAWQRRITTLRPTYYVTGMTVDQFPSNESFWPKEIADGDMIEVDCEYRTIV